MDVTKKKEGDPFEINGCHLVFENISYFVCLFPLSGKFVLLLTLQIIRW